MRLIALILLFIFPSWAAAQKYDSKITIADISPVWVKIGDSAKNGCWTNLKETKNYAEGQIEIIGGKTGETAGEAYSTMNIYVIAEKIINTERCYGSITITFERGGSFEGHFAYILFSQIDGIGIKTNNFNTFV